MICGMCGGNAELVRENRAFPVGSRTVMIDDEFFRCARCGESYYIDGMEVDTLQRATGVIRAEDGLLAPDEIVALRGKYGLSQAALERLIGAGEKTVVRWERGTVSQNRTADTLLRILGEHPAIVAQLASERGVRLNPKRAPRARAAKPKAAPAPVRRSRADAA